MTLPSILGLPALLLAGALLATHGSATELSGQERATRAGAALLGKPAPQPLLTTIDGERIDLGSLVGKKAVYLKFWATWCIPCREQMPHFQKVYETRGDDLEVIAINAGFNDSVADIRKYRTQLGITMPIVLDDGRLGELFHLRVTPQHIVIGRDGSIRYVGHLADASLDAALAAARKPGPTRLEPAIAGDARDRDLPLGAGDPVPDRMVRVLDGKVFPLRDGAGDRPLVLVFLSPWCESYLATSRPQVAANCRAARLQVAGLAKAGTARWLGVASGLWATA